MKHTTPLLLWMVLGSAVACAQTRPAATQPTDHGLAGEVTTHHFEPEPIRVTLEGLPEPYSSESVSNSPEIIEVPEEPVLEVPAGFRVQVFADVDKARWLAMTPEGEVLCVSSRTNTIYKLSDPDGDGVAEEKTVFADEGNGLKLPFGIAFVDQHFYVGNTDAVVRWRYGDGQERIEGEPETVTELPGQGYNQHWTRNVVASPDMEWLYMTVGSKSNVDREDPPRASVLRMRPDGSEREVYASGLRNPVGLDFHPETGEVYATVNERDGLGDNLVPDYLARVERDGFYGWPYAYLTPKNIDPRRMEGERSERPELVKETITPEVLFESHSAALGLAFYPMEGAEEADGAARHGPARGMFPERYRGGAFVAFRGSWNRSRGTGYKIVFVPFDEEGRPAGYYEDFVRGFLVQPEVPRTWGRPVGVLVLPDGSLLFTEEEHGRVYRVSYGGR